MKRGFTLIELLVVIADWHVGWMAAERMTIDMWRFYDR